MNRNTSKILIKIFFIIFISVIINNNIIFAKNNQRTQSVQVVNKKSQNIIQKSSINRIEYQNNNNQHRFIFYSQIKPKYTVNQTKNQTDINFFNLLIDKNTFESFKKSNNLKNIELKKFNNYTVFRIFNSEKIIKNIFTNPNKITKDYKIIIDIQKNKEVKKEKTNNKEIKKIDIKKNNIKNKTMPVKKEENLAYFIEKNILSNKVTEQINNENINYTELEDLINKINDIESDDDKLNNFLNELLEFKILEQELKETITAGVENAKYNLNNFLNTDVFKEKTEEKQENINFNDRNRFVNYKNKKYFIVILDAGHGGKDPGTIGVKKSKEKNVNLIYTQTLKNELEKNKKIKVFLTRNDDTYLSLNERMKIARNYKPDLFLSLHSNYSSNKKTSGLSVFTLSKIASDKRTAELANEENRNNILAGIDLYNEYQDTINVLVDLSRVEILNESKIFANILVDDFKKYKLDTIENPNKSASFGVLLAPDFPSILIELGFLSNKYEEQKLQSYYHRKKIIKSIVKSVERYFNIN